MQSQGCSPPFTQKMLLSEKKVNHLIKEISKKNSVVVDGRDIGTEVLPNSDIKIFLTSFLGRELEEDGKN